MKRKKFNGPKRFSKKSNKSAIAITAVAVAAALAATLAFADDTVVIPADQFMLSLFQFIGGVKGLGGLAMIAAVVQLLMLFFKSTLANFAGRYRLMIVAALTVAASIVGLMSQGMTLTAALINGATLTAVQVLAHQIWKQFVVKKEEAVG